MRSMPSMSLLPSDGGIMASFLWSMLMFAEFFVVPKQAGRLSVEQNKQSTAGCYISGCRTSFQEESRF